MNATHENEAAADPLADLSEAVQEIRDRTNIICEMMDARDKAADRRMSAVEIRLTALAEGTVPGIVPAIKAEVWDGTRAIQAGSDRRFKAIEERLAATEKRLDPDRGPIRTANERIGVTLHMLKQVEERVAAIEARPNTPPPPPADPGRFFHIDTEATAAISAKAKALGLLAPNGGIPGAPTLKELTTALETMYQWSRALRSLSTRVAIVEATPAPTEETA